MHPSVSSDIKSPAQSGLSLFLSAVLRPIVEASLMHQLTSPYISFSLCLSATVYLQSIYSCGYHSLCHIIKPPPFPLHTFWVSLPLFVLLFVLTLYCSPLSLSPVAHRQRLCEWLSEKFTLLLQTNSFFGFSCCVPHRERDRNVAQVKSDCSLRLEECPSIKDSVES